MSTICVTLPATSANLGPGLGSMAIALGLYITLEVSDVPSGFEIAISGLGKDVLPHSQANRTVEAMRRVFREVGYLPAGLHLRVVNNIPVECGFGGSAAATLAGAIAANELLGSPLGRERVIQIALGLESVTPALLASLWGGLVISAGEGDEVSYAPVELPPMTVVGVLPAYPAARVPFVPPNHVAHQDAVANIGYAALVAVALMRGDYDLLAKVMRDRLHEEARGRDIPGYDSAVRAALSAGAAAVAISGSGPALVAFAESKHDAIGAAMAQVFSEYGAGEAAVFLMPVDSRGIVISEVGVALRNSDEPIPASSLSALS